MCSKVYYVIEIYRCFVYSVGIGAISLQIAFFLILLSDIESDLLKENLFQGCILSRSQLDILGKGFIVDISFRVTTAALAATSLIVVLFFLIRLKTARLGRIYDIISFEIVWASFISC